MIGWITLGWFSLGFTFALGHYIGKQSVRTELEDLHRLVRLMSNEDNKEYRKLWADSIQRNDQSED